ncbi:MAG: AraC family transcriptional regulator [Clostridiaceae bacterium]|nr:AraC family transcriptional regulator [Clostridiaceae bacterium]
MLDLFSLTQLIKLLHAPICIYHENGELFQALEDVEGKILIEQDAFKQEIPKDYPYVQVEKDGAAYCLMWAEEMGKWIALGKLRIYYSSYTEQLKQYPYCDKDEFAAIISLIWKNVSGREIGASSLWFQNLQSEERTQEMVSRGIFEVQEEGRTHNPYSQELRELDSIRRGDMKALQDSMDEVYSGKAGILAKDEIRQQKNLAICTITLASRSAIQGGLNPELSFSMSDSFIWNIEENLSDPVQIARAARDAEMEYTSLVHDLQRMNTNPLINQIRDYVFCHMHEPIRVKDIADDIGVTPNYLSEQFSKNTGMTLKQYIINEKISSSERMLKYTEYSLQEISTICAFSSQSRFCVYFQRKNGITPAKYRKLYQKK